MSLSDVATPAPHTHGARIPSDGQGRNRLATALGHKTSTGVNRGILWPYRVNGVSPRRHEDVATCGGN